MAIFVVHILETELEVDELNSLLEERLEDVELEELEELDAEELDEMQRWRRSSRQLN
jgi:hypothetical protein